MVQECVYTGGGGGVKEVYTSVAGTPFVSTLVKQDGTTVSDTSAPPTTINSASEYISALIESGNWVYRAKKVGNYHFKITGTASAEGDKTITSLTGDNDKICAHTGGYNAGESATIVAL